MFGKKGANVSNIYQQTTDAYKRAKLAADIGFTGSSLVLGGASMVSGSSTVTTNLGTSVPRGGVQSLSRFNRRGSNFAQRLFHSKTLGKNSKLFGNKQFSSTDTPGLLNRPGGRIKIGWSGGQEEMRFTRPRFNNGGLNLRTFKTSNPTFTGGGRQFRMTIGVNRRFPNRGNLHLYVPRTFVPNSVANPFIVK